MDSYLTMSWFSPDWALLLTATLTAIAVAFTPGPNNVILTTIGANNGIKVALPYALGVTFGFPCMFFMAGNMTYHLTELLSEFGWIMKLASVAFLFYLAWKIGFAPPPREQQQDVQKKIPGFFWAFFFQFVNPKGVSFALSISVLYIRADEFLMDLILLMVSLSVISLLSTLTWASIGKHFGNYLSTDSHYRIFNTLMGLFLFVTALVIAFYQ